MDVLDASYEETKRTANDANNDDVRVRRKVQAELYSADIKVGPSCASVPSDLELLHCPISDCSAFSVHNSTMSAPSRELFGGDQRTV